MSGVLGEPIGGDEIGREPDAIAGLRSEQLFDLVEHLLLHHRVPYLVPLGAEQREAHAASDEHQIDTRQEVADDAQFVGHLRPAQDHRERPGRVLHEGAECLDFGEQERTRNGGNKLGDADGRCVCPVGGPERVQHEQVGELGEVVGEVAVVLGLSRLEAGVLEQQDIARRRCCHGCFHCRTDDTIELPHREPADVAHCCGHRVHSELWLTVLGTAEVAGHHYRGAAVAEPFDGRQRGPDTEVIRHLAVADRHVEIRTDQHTTTGDVDVVQCQEIAHLHLHLFASAASTLPSLIGSCCGQSACASTTSSRTRSHPNENASSSANSTGCRPFGTTSAPR